MLRDFVGRLQYRAAELDYDTATHIAGVQRMIAEAAQSAATANENAQRAAEAAAKARDAAEEAAGYAKQAQESAAKAKEYADDAAESASQADQAAQRAAASARQAREAADSAGQAAASATRSADQAAASAAQARTYASLAYASAERARADALAANKDAADAAVAAVQALQIAANKLREEEKKWREAGAKPGGEGSGTVDALKGYENGSFLLEFNGTCYLNGIALPDDIGMGSCKDLGADFDKWIGDFAGSVEWGTLKGHDDAALRLLAAYCNYDDTRPFIGHNNRDRCGSALLKQLNDVVPARYYLQSGVGSSLVKLGKIFFKKYGKKFGKRLGISSRPPMNQLAHNRALFEQYKDILREEVAKPYVKDPRLSEFVDDLYRKNARIGSGSTAAAVRLELRTGAKVGERFHSQKARDAIVHLKKWR